MKKQENDFESTAIENIKELCQMTSELKDRLSEIIQYCEPHQEFMWAKYITGIAKGKKDWRDE